MILNEPIKITEITSGISKDKKRVWTMIKYVYLDEKYLGSEFTYTYWTDISEVNNTKNQ